MLPEATFSLQDLPAMRERAAEWLGPLPETPDISVRDMVVDGFGAQPDVRVRVYSPLTRGESPSAGIYWMHGGGLVMGSIEVSDLDCIARVRDLGCVVASVDYRLAPEDPYPAAINDCVAGYYWFHDNAVALGVDSSRIAIAGESAGGALAASLALYCRDHSGPPACLQLLSCPMLDHRNLTHSSHAVRDPRIWNRERNVQAWEAYLGGSECVEPYASPAIADDLALLPPVFASVGDLDLFVDETIDYVRRLRQAEVPTELHVYAGVFHGAHRYVPAAPPSERWRRDENAVLRSYLLNEDEATGGREAT